LVTAFYLKSVIAGTRSIAKVSNRVEVPPAIRRAINSAARKLNVIPFPP
jgi:hypothetical protein